MKEERLYYKGGGERRGILNKTGEGYTEKKGRGILKRLDTVPMVGSCSCFPHLFSGGHVVASYWYALKSLPHEGELLLSQM